MDMWLSMAGGKQLRAQKDERREIASAAIQRETAPASEDVPCVVPANERAESEDPNDYEPPNANVGQSEAKKKSNNPYDYSDDSGDDGEYADF